MFILQGRILTINIISDKSAQIVVQKQVNKKKTPIAINIWGFWKDKMDLLKLQPKEKIEGRVYAKSTLWKGKWYTDLYFKDVFRSVDKPKSDKPQEQNMFDNEEFGIGNVRLLDEDGNILL
jgi:hypothetical protein